MNLEEKIFKTETVYSKNPIWHNTFNMNLSIGYSDLISQNLIFTIFHGSKDKIIGKINIQIH